MPAALPVALGIAWCAFVVLTHFSAQGWQPGYDIAIYRRGGADLLAGRDLYLAATARGHYFVYPPLAAVLLAPLLLLPPWLALLVWDAVLVAAVVLAVRLLVRIVAPGGSGLAAGLAIGAVLLSDPFKEAVVLGQISPLVVLGLVVGCALGGRTGAVLAALAGAVKVTPALVLTAAAQPAARRRFAVPVAVAGALLTLVGGLAAFASWRHYFTDLLWNSARVAEPDTPSNNSLAGGLAHAGVPNDAALVVAGVLAVPLVGLLLVAARRSDWDLPHHRLRFGLLVALVAVLVTPVAWSHHALAAPLAAVLVAATRPPRRLLLAVLGLGLLPWLLPVLEAAADLRGGWRVLTPPLALT
ncbi:glycosyltransferase 87 family protein, partial [Kineococcus glutinatus]|uniref:glycosyltransferase 87 family protein n=1 Tax=Kineococcus glutinatus TaxID=1070872 RepID=UPI0031E8180D